MTNIIYLLRLLKKNKITSILNILGLSIGIASFILILLYVNYELSYDKFYTNSDRVYRVFVNYLNEGGDVYEQDANTYNKSGEAILELCSEVISYTRTCPLQKSGLIKEKEIIEIENMHLADSSFFNVFGYSLLKGEPETALSQPNSIVLTETESHKIFGSEDPMGKTIETYANDKKLLLTVKGIIRDIPENTHMPIKSLVSYCTSNMWKNEWQPNWRVNNYFTFILVEENTDAQLLNSKIQTLEYPGNKRENHSIEPLTDIHLHSDKSYEVGANGNSNTVNLLLAISIIVILLSWINYINISVSQSIDRNKEVGMRKISGANKKQIILQSIYESLLNNGVAVIAVMAFLPFIIHFFNRKNSSRFYLGVKSGKV